MEMGIVTALCVAFCGICALCSVACLIVMLANCKVEGDEDGRSRTPAPTAPPKDTTDDVEKRRRQAVQAAHHRNFMDYDGSPQQPVDPNTILADGG